MPGYRPEYTEYTSKATVLMRLTHQDTLFLKARIEEALAKKTGVNLVFVSMNGAFSVTHSLEQGKEIKFIAFNKSGTRVESEMRGYNGPWSHIEIAVPYKSIADLERFIVGAPHEHLVAARSAPGEMG